MQWVKFPIRFDEHAALFTISRRQASQDVEWFNRLTEMASGPECEEIIRRYVLFHRPELTGCMIHYMGYDPSGGKFEIHVSHHSLETNPLGCYPKRIPLIKPSPPPQPYDG